MSLNPVLTQLSSTSSYSRAIFATLPHFPVINSTLRWSQRGIGSSDVRCAAGGGGSERKAPARLSQFQQLLDEAEERALSVRNEPTPKITLDHMTVSFARSGGLGGQNVDKCVAILLPCLEIIDAAAYFLPPPSEEQKKEVAKIAAIREEKRQKSEKVLSDKKAFQRS